MRSILLFVVALAACSRGPEADLPSIAEARSLGAEWALVNEQAARGRLTAAYTQTMRKELRHQLASDQRVLTQPNSPYGAEIQALLAERDDAPSQGLRGHVAKLKQIEDRLESA